jgi:hypothetical protein
METLMNNKLEKWETKCDLCKGKKRFLQEIIRIHIYMLVVQK